MERKAISLMDLSSHLSTGCVIQACLLICKMVPSDRSICHRHVTWYMVDTLKNVKLLSAGTQIVFLQCLCRAVVVDKAPNTHTHTHSFIYTCTYTHIYMHMYGYMYIYMYTTLYIHLYEYKQYKYTYTYTWFSIY